jgi:hypothetical protein
MFALFSVALRPKVRHPLPSRVPKPIVFLVAVFTDGAILSRSSVHGDRRQPPGPFSFPGSLARGDSRAPRATRPPRRSAAQCSLDMHRTMG